MAFPAALRLGLVALAAAALAGCFGGKDTKNRCDEPAEYQASTSVPGLTTPEGLAAPARASGYTLPPATGAELRGAACLARPPPYFRPEAPAAPAGATPPANAPSGK